MFDVGFSELIVVALVALVVIGPERLPRVARTAGHLLGRLQRYVSDVKSDISREIQLDELKKVQQDIEQSARGVESSLKEEFSSVESSLNNSILPAAGDGPSEPVAAADGAAATVADGAQMELGLDAQAKLEQKSG
jgi:sec-independent protein translocase protein TatB